MLTSYNLIADTWEENTIYKYIVIKYVVIKYVVIKYIFFVIKYTMSLLTTSHSTSLVSTNGDIDTGRGQLGYTAIGILAGNVNDLWALTSPNKPHFCVIDCLADCAVQLPAIGTSSSQANLGHRISIHNKSGVGNIDIQDSSSGSIYVLAPGVVTTLIATTAPNGWDFTTMTAPSSATLQTAYNAGNTILEIPNRPVTITDDSGNNPSIFDVQSGFNESLLKVGNATPAVYSPYVEMKFQNIGTPRPFTIYSSSVNRSYASVASDTGKHIEIYDDKREVMGNPSLALGSPLSSIVRETIPVKTGANNTTPTTYTFTGLPDTTYQFRIDIMMKDPLSFCSSQLIFGMNNGAVSNTLSSLYQENQINSPITVDPIYTITTSGSAGVNINFQAPDYPPLGFKNYEVALIITIMGVSF